MQQATRIKRRRGDVFRGTTTCEGRITPVLQDGGIAGLHPQEPAWGTGREASSPLLPQEPPARSACAPLRHQGAYRCGKFCIWSARASRARVPPRWGDDPAAGAEPVSCSAAREGLGAGASSEAAEGPERGMGAQPPCRPGRASGRAAYSRRKGLRAAQEAPAPCRLNPALRIGQAVDQIDGVGVSRGDDAGDVRSAHALFQRLLVVRGGALPAKGRV